MAQVKIFDIKYGDPRRLHDLLSIYQVPIKADPTLRTISVTAQPETMKLIEETIKRYDVPAAIQNLEFTIYMLIASPDPAKRGDLPPALEPVIKQIAGTFNYKGFRIGETMLLRSRDGSGAEASAMGPNTGADNQRVFYQFRFAGAAVLADEKGKVIRLNNLRAGMRVPYRTGSGAQATYQFAEIGLSTDIDIREGQKAVVGKSNLDGNEAMIVVVIPRVVE
jgi:hypothetical protein